ncbi:uncharacterized protein LOC126974692 isoform X2 [Leptidea sinapis]|uniref:uncharacterized protein LOC126974692 isoform X2 n=1 Tax=Leptidea sinapis TaxID=189913 RepID=UPI0021C2F924|nr:uncharacterized protein LOC126974692 isoform X2 [Leptidea sinapis]
MFFQRWPGFQNPPIFLEENYDSLSSNFFDSLNHHVNLDYRNKNPYAIPANLNHKIIPEYYENNPFVPSQTNVGNFRIDKGNVMVNPVSKDSLPLKKNMAFTVDLRKPQSKVFNRLFPAAAEKEPPKVPPRNFHLNLNEKPQPKTPKPNARSIFKNYKSCPVSPVSEECKWADKLLQNQTEKNKQIISEAKKRNSLSFDKMRDSKNIVNTIKSDTEKMIAEITRKYGDLDEYGPNSQGDLDLQPTKEEKDDGNFSSDSLEDCSLSQDASCKNKLYSKKICKKHNKNKTSSMPKRSISNYEINGTYDKPKIPMKPVGVELKSSTLPRNMPSNLEEIMQEDINSNPSMYRCQSVLTRRCITRSNESVLSDHSNCSSVSNEIFLKYGNEVAFQQAKFSDSRYYFNDSQNCSIENINEPDEKYLEKHRHSSASFFLNQKRHMKMSCSQDSIISDEFLDNDNQLSRTNCNSLESVLSDDSECTKSAPLEMLFESARGCRKIPNSQSCYEFDNSSKSYGSSPNNVPYLSGYMYNNYFVEASTPKVENQEPIRIIAPKSPGHNVYGFDVPCETSGHKTVTRSRSLYDSKAKQPSPHPKNIAYYFDGNNLQPYTVEKKGLDDIPRLKDNNHIANTSKSLQPKFSEKQKYKCEMDGCEQKNMVKSKSCSFEVVLEPASKPNPLKNLMEKRNSHVKKNLEKFEEQIRKSSQTKFCKNQINKEKANVTKYINATKSLERDSGQRHNNNNKITMEFVPHKPPKPIKRTSSTKQNNRLKTNLEKSGLSSSISSQYKAKLDGLQNKNYISNKKHDQDGNSNTLDIDSSEKSFDVFVKEKEINDNKSEIQMDSLEVFALQKMERRKQMSMDSLDVSDDNHDFAKDSLDYYAEQHSKYSDKRKKDKFNLKLSINDFETPTTSGGSENVESKENIAPESEEVKKYRYIERKLEIINKLVEMEERKLLQEKVLKEWRMRPLEANLNNGKGVVKVLSQKFEKLATKQNTVHNFASLTLEEGEKESDCVNIKEIKRNLSLPDILDTEQIGLTSEEMEVTNDSGNDCADQKESDPKGQLNNRIQSEAQMQKTLPQRVYNEMIYPKTDVHLDSENYESSTTSSSCTNSPKRLSFYGFHRPKIFRKIIRHPTPRLCLVNQSRMRPPLCSGNTVRDFTKKNTIVPVLPSKFTPPSGPTKPTTNANVKSPSGFVRPAPRYNKSNMTRSSSVGVLNQSDSESDPQPSRTQPRTGGLMRPTISSMNKAAANTARRRGLANSYSTVNVARSDSSSEPEERNETPQARPRAASADRASRRLGRSGSDRDLSAKARDVTNRLAGNQRQRKTEVAEIPSSQLCSALTEQLTKTASKVATLYRSLQREAGASADISGLEAAILETQKVLRAAVQGEPDNRQRIDNLLSQEASTTGNPAMTIIEQYSDILLNMMQNKMVSQFSQSPQSLPPREPGAES